MMKDSEFDLVVVGGTPGGVVAAIRAAREGLQVLLTHYHAHLGGLLSSGIGALDTQYGGKRAPIHGEFCERLIDHYRDTYGADSEQLKICLYHGHSKFWDLEQARGGNSVDAVNETEVAALSDESGYYYGKMRFEAKVAEQIINDLVGAEKGVEIWRNCYPVSAERAGRMISAVDLESSGDGTRARVKAKAFIDASYEGDLMAVAGAPYRIGRESRSEFDEIHAGKIFTALHFADEEEVGYPREAVEGTLNLEPYRAISQQILAGSTGEGDHKIQAYNYRVNLTSDPENRIMPEKPVNYNRDAYLALRDRWGVGMILPNNKRGWNTANLPGGAYDYPDGDWETRREVARRHKDHALGLIYFLQHDEDVPEALRRQFEELGLPKDEFADNDNFPHEMYAREGRRLDGRYMLSEGDCTPAPELGRAPVHEDSIAIAEWTMDSHSVSFEKMPGGRHEGKVLLTEMTRPAQIPYRTILPPDIDNLLVPVCLSATHIAWGTVRVEPTWMHICESAAHAVALAAERGVTPADVAIDELQERLVNNGIMISFFNEFDMSSQAHWCPAVQFLGTKGFFPSYDTRPDDPLTRSVATVWIEAAGSSANLGMSATECARQVETAEKEASAPITVRQFLEMVGESSRETGQEASSVNLASFEHLSPDGPIARSDACGILADNIWNGAFRAEGEDD
jgi:hypothetical protein